MPMFERRLHHICTYLVHSFMYAGVLMCRIPVIMLAPYSLILKSEARRRPMLAHSVPSCAQGLPCSSLYT